MITIDGTVFNGLENVIRFDVVTLWVIRRHSIDQEMSNISVMGSLVKLFYYVCNYWTVFSKTAYEILRDSVALQMYALTLYTTNDQRVQKYSIAAVKWTRLKREIMY